MSTAWSSGLPPAALVLAAGLAAAVGGCRTYPQIRHRQTRVGNVSPDGMQLVLDLEAVNLGRRACVLTECRYKLKLAGQQYLRGRRDANLYLTPGGRAAWSLPVEVDVREALQLTEGVERGRRVPFELNLDFTCRPGAGPGRWSIRSDTAGELPLPAEPDIRVERVTVTQLTDEQAAVLVDVVLHNPNDQPLTLMPLQYELALAGYEMGTGTLAAPPVIPAGGTVRVRLGGSRAVMGARFGLGRRLTLDRIAYTLRGQGRVRVGLEIPWSFSAKGTVPVMRPERLGGP